MLRRVRIHSPQKLSHKGAYGSLIRTNQYTIHIEKYDSDEAIRVPRFSYQIPEQKQKSGLGSLPEYIDLCCYKPEGVGQTSGDKTEVVEQVTGDRLDVVRQTSGDRSDVVRQASRDRPGEVGQTS